MIRIKINSNNISKFQIFLLYIAILLLSFLLCAVFAVLSLVIINYCWNNPAWATLTLKHVLGFSLLLLITSIITNSGNND